MGLYGFFGVSKKDAAVLWSALNLIDKHKQEIVHIKDFASTFCPKSHDLFERMFDKYSYISKAKVFKASTTAPGPVDDAALGMDADELMAFLAKSESEQAAQKAKYDEEQRIKLQAEMHARHRPDYVKFLCFLLFFMSIPDENMPVWIYWLWYALPKVRPTKENIHGLVGNLWHPDNFNISWYAGEVRYIVKVIDPSFNARTFQLTDQRCGGAWSIPFHEMRAELYTNFERKPFFDRLATGFEHAVHNLELGMRRMKDLRLKGAPTDHTDAGDRGDARHDIRSFVLHYKTYANMPMDAEETFSDGNCMKTISMLLGEKIKYFTGPCTRCWKKIVPKDIDITMGMGSEGYVRPNSRSTLAKLKRELAQKSGRVEKEKEVSHDGELKLAEEEAEAEKKRLVPLEYKYRKQLELPPRVLNHKAIEMRAQGQQLLRRCDLEVVDEATILSAFDMTEFGTNINIDPLDDDESNGDLGGVSIRSQDDDEDDSYA